MCDCAKYEDLEFFRTAISSRIKDSIALRKNLALLASHPDKEHRLYRCDACGQLWQGSRAWNWGNDEYLFRVPTVAKENWVSEVFVQPDELLIFTAVIGDFLERNSFSNTDHSCSVSGCERSSTTGVRTCLPHHIESLQNIGQLPKNPVGRWFGPYKYESIIPCL